MTQHLMEQPLSPALPGKMRGILSAKRASPESPDSVNTGNTRSGDLDYGVLWSQQYGGKCPRCGKFQKTAYRHTPWQDGRKIRYHRCPGCGYHFKSIAEDAARLDLPPAPETLALLRKYGK